VDEVDIQEGGIILIVSEYDISDMVHLFNLPSLLNALLGFVGLDITK